MSRKTRKLIWSAPLVAVLAVAGALAIFAALEPAPASAHGIPGAPGDVVATADGATAIDLSWTAPTTGGDPTGYRIDRSMNGNVWTTLVANTGNTNLTYSDTGLKPAKGYYYRVFAINSAGTGPVAKDGLAYTTVAGAPDMPTGLTATAMGKNKVTLSWLPPAKNGGAPVTSYRIHVWSHGGMVTATGVPAEAPSPDDSDVATVITDGIIVVNHDDAMTRQSYEHKDATANTSYLYQVFAINSAGTSPPTDPENATTDKLDKPSAPTNLVASQTTNTNVDLFWSAPANNGGAEISGYRVEVWTKAAGAAFVKATEASPAWTDSAIVAKDASYTISDNLEQVRFRVYAQTGVHSGNNSTGLESSASNWATITVQTGANRIRAVHSAPLTTENSATRDPDDNVKVSWNAPESLAADTGPSTVSGYMLDVSDDGINWSRLNRSTGRTTTQYLYKDTETRLRHYRVLAWNAGYVGASSAVFKDNLVVPTPGSPSGVRNLMAKPMGPTQIDLTWDEPTNKGNAPLIHYIVFAMSKGSSATWPAWPESSITADTWKTDTDASNGITLAFQTKDGMTRKYSHRNLTAGETWRYQVVAVNQSVADGSTPNYGPLTGAYRTASTSRETMPRKPEGLTAEPAKDSSGASAQDRGVLLQWNAPDAPAGAMIANYEIERKVGAGSWTMLATTTNNWTNYTDESEPKAGEMRQYRVRAVSDKNKVKGNWSNVAYYPGLHTAATAHIAAQNSIAAQTVTAGMSLAAMDVSSYFTVTDGITYSATSSSDAIATASVNGSMVTITGVAAGSATITVKATEDATGLYAMQPITVTVASPALTPPTKVMASNDGLVVTVMWEGGENADTFYVALLRRDAEGNWDIPNAVYDAAPSGSPFTVNMATRPAGTYLVFVTAGSAADGWSNWVSGTLDYAP